MVIKLINRTLIFDHIFNLQTKCIMEKLNLLLVTILVSLFMIGDIYGQKLELKAVSINMGATRSSFSQSSGTYSKVNLARTENRVYSANIFVKSKNFLFATGIGFRTVKNGVSYKNDYYIYFNNDFLELKEQQENLLSGYYPEERFIPASYIYTKNNYVVIPIGVEFGNRLFKDGFSVYVRPAIEVNLIVSNDRIFIQSLNLSYFDRSQAVGDKFSRTKFSSTFSSNLKAGFRFTQGRVFLDSNIGITIYNKNRFDDFGTLKETFSMEIGLGYAL